MRVVEGHVGVDHGLHVAPRAALRPCSISLGSMRKRALRRQPRGQRVERAAHLVDLARSSRRPAAPPARRGRARPARSRPSSAAAAPAAPAGATRPAAAAMSSCVMRSPGRQRAVADGVEQAAVDPVDQVGRGFELDEVGGHGCILYTEYDQVKLTSSLRIWQDCVKMLQTRAGGTHEVARRRLARTACTTTGRWCPTTAGYLARWAADSARPRAAQPCELDMRLRRRRRARRWTSSRRRTPDAPVLVFIHGGYWRALDKSDHSFIAPGLHARRRLRGGAQLRAVPGRRRSRRSCCRWCARWPGPGATSRASAATRRASPWRAIRPAATWRR